MRTKIKAIYFIILGAWFVLIPTASAVGFGISSGVDYQDRNFSSDSIEYDCRQILFFIQPQVSLGAGWRIFARVGYSNLVYDSPSAGGKDYDEWGYEWGGGVGWTPFRWSGLYLGTEAGFFITRTSGSSREGEYLNWGVDVRAGWDLEVIDAYVGAAYDDGLIRDSSSESGNSFSEDYRLDDPWSLFAGARLKVPFLPNLHGRYYFSKDRLALLALTYDF